MNKRITSLLLCFVMVFSMLASAVPAWAVDPTPFYIDHDKVNGAHPGDTITYTVKMGSIEGMAGLMLEMNIPDELEYISGSGKAADGIQTKLNAILAAYTDSTRIFAVGMSNYTGSGEIELFSFQCKVKDNVAGAIAVTFADIEVVDNDNVDIPYDLSNLRSTVTVSAKPVSVTGVSFTNKTLSLDLNEEKELAYTVSPGDATNKAVTFSVAGDAVTVTADGKVLGVKEGTATITITTVDGGFIDTCTVTVACSHVNKAAVEAQVSDCKTQGWDAYVKCNGCGQLFAANGTTEIDEIPFRAFGNHTGGTATCTAQAICSVCSQPYGTLKPHDYTADEKKPEALNTPGNCRDKAVYWYSCAVCGAVESNDNHTFNGDKVATTHVGGTTLVNVSEANHKTQTKGYTGDTKCLGCGEIIGYGQEILPGAHVAGTAWFSDGTNHWNVCSVGDCGHTMNLGACAGGTATCMDKATCTTCGNEYGDVNSNNHTAAATWTQITEGDKEYHYKACENGCDTQLEKNACTGGTVTCVDRATCTTCSNKYGTVDTTNGHNWNTAWSNDINTNEHYKACSNGCTHRNEVAAHSSTGDNVATCQHANECDVCGVPYGSAVAHEAAANVDWEKDASGHWKLCKYGCGTKVDVADHDPSLPGGATTTAANVCKICDYVIEAKLHAHSFTAERTDAQYLKSGATCQSAAVYYKSCSDDTCRVSAQGIDETAVFTYGNVAEHEGVAAWSSDDTHHWHECKYGCGEDVGKASHGEPVWKYNASTNKHWSECPTCQHKLTAEAAHVDANNDGKCDVCNGTVRKPGGGHYFHFDYNNDGKCDYCGTKVVIDPVESGKTFDGGIALYIGMSIAAATGGAAMVVSKKRKEND